MKQVNIIIANVVMVGMVACSQSANSQEGTDGGQKEKRAVVYFSATGTTKHVAENLAKIANADIYEIQPAVPYTDADLDWRDSHSRSSVEMKDKTSRPAIANKIENLADYDVIYIGFPIWWNTAPTIVNTFIESHSLAGKTLIPFATSGSSSIDGACKDLKKQYPDIVWKEGRLLNHVTDEVLKKWVK